MSEQPSLAELAARKASDAVELAKCLAEFEDDPSCCSEWVEAEARSSAALDRALGLIIDTCEGDYHAWPLGVTDQAICQCGQLQAALWPIN